MVWLSVGGPGPVGGTDLAKPGPAAGSDPAAQSVPAAEPDEAAGEPDEAAADLVTVVDPPEGY